MATDHHAPELPAPDFAMANVHRVSAPALVGWAAELGDQILRDARMLDDGSLTWDRGFDLAERPVSDSGLFNGRVGEALLFAALARATKAPHFEEAVHRISEPLRNTLRSANAVDDLIARIGLGTSGVGSIVYAFAQIASFLECPPFARDAVAIVEHASRDAISASDHVDVTWGLAGWILGALSLPSAGIDAAIASARVATHALMARRVSDEHTHLRALPTIPYAAPATGFAHGNSGIACALLRMARVAADLPSYDAAVELFAFERTLYRDDVSDWMETHADARQTMCAWCHGAPGVALARVEAVPLLRVADEAAITLDLQRALRRTATARYGQIDTLCCGALGRVDCLLESSCALSNESLAAAARGITEQVVRLSHPSAYHFSRSAEPHVAGGMWQGLTGIAYELLRVADPNATPTVLSLRPVT